MDIKSVKAELDKKFTGTVYSCNAVFASKHPSGVSIWKLEFTELKTGQRKPEYDGPIKRLPNGVTSTL